MTELYCEDSCGGGKAHVNGLHAAGQQSLMESQKSSSEIALYEKLWDLYLSRELSRLHEHYFTSQQSAFPSDVILKKNKKKTIYWWGFVVDLRMTSAELDIWQENLISLSLNG